MNGFTKCRNGHYYKEELSTCPYCPAGNKSSKTADHKKETQLYTESSEENNTRIILSSSSSMQTNNRTVFGDEVISELGSGEIVIKKEYRSGRKLVGWLVSYSFDKMGVDFRLYEGRNIIGRDVECNITIPDKTISNKHATVLFKNDKFKIKDELSSHGTFVNDNDIEDETIELHDNDIIRIGETILKFKVAL
ncbi:FHA domain-containing protein [Bacteroidales bacterium OttesenSCG-928-M06]|nr:FHA domain-containing protein [Bacteroidales bacterium OttesenSCG-928-M06]